MKNIATAHGVNKWFGDFQALKDVELHIPEGQITGLLGPNGAGKTTFIRMLCGITAPDSGALRLDVSDKISEIGYLPEERGLYRKMKVWELARYLVMLKGFDSQKAEALLTPWFEELAMDAWRNQRIESLSKGMQQRLQFVICVAPQPKLIILDEPFSGFDPVNAAIMKQQIKKLQDADCTIILSTHDMNNVESLCDHICLINKGQVVINESLASLREQHSKDLFNVSFKGSEIAFAQALGYEYQILHMEERSDHRWAQVKASHGGNSSALIQSISQHVEIQSFDAITASMNDIFVSLVAEPAKTEIDE